MASTSNTRLALIMLYLMRLLGARSKTLRHKTSETFAAIKGLPDSSILKEGRITSTSHSSLQCLPHELQLMVLVYALEDLVDTALIVARKTRVSATHPFSSLLTRIGDLAVLSMSSFSSTVAALRTVLKRQDQICGAFEA